MEFNNGFPLCLALQKNLRIQANVVIVLGSIQSYYGKTGLDRLIRRCPHGLRY